MYFGGPRQYRHDDGGYRRMKDLIQCSIARDDFLRWLELGHAPFTVWQGEKAAATLIRLEKKPSVDCQRQ